MNNYLFPRKFHLFGWILFIPATIMGAMAFCGLGFFSGISGIIVNDAIIIGVILGALFIVCSKEKVEDEMTISIRLKALLNSVYVYAIISIICTLAINGMAYLYFMMANLVLFPMIYVITFKLKMHRYNKLTEDEE